MQFQCQDDAMVFKEWLNKHAFEVKRKDKKKREEHNLHLNIALYFLQKNVLKKVF